MSDNNKTEEIVDAEIIEESPTVNETWLDRLFSANFWLRVIFMCLFVIVLSLATYLVLALIIFQVFYVLITGKPNTEAKVFAQSLVIYIQQSLGFLNYSTDEKPFPFKDWPKQD